MQGPKYTSGALVCLDELTPEAKGWKSFQKFKMCVSKNIFCFIIKTTSKISELGCHREPYLNRVFLVEFQNLKLTVLENQAEKKELTN